RAARLAKRRQPVLADQPHAFQVDGEAAVEGLHGELRGHRVAQREAGPHVVVQDVQPTEALQGRRDQPAGVVFAGDVRFEGPGLAALVADQVHGLLGGLEGAVGHDDLRAFPGEHDGGGPPVPDRLARRLPASHHDGRLTLDALCHVWEATAVAPRWQVQPRRPPLSETTPEEKITPVATIFLSAGNITHTPAYGNLIALGILDASQQRYVSSEQIAHIAAYRELIGRTGRFLTFSAGAATIGFRFREDPLERAAVRVVRETDAGLVLSGKVGMHTSPAYAEDVYVGAHCAVDRGPHRASFIVPVNAPGVTILCRKISARHPNPFIAPLSSRYDELDGQMWLENVLVPWERIFLM